MGLALQVILLLAISVTFFVQGSAGSNISPSPSLFTVVPPILGLPVIPIDVNAPSPASLPNVSQIPPLLPPVNSTPVPETGTGKVTAPTLSPNTSPPSTGHELVLPPVANTSPPSPSHDVVPPPVANTSPPSPSHELAPPPVANTSPPSPSHELAPPPVANTSPPSPSHELAPPPVANTSPPSPSHELAPPPVANTSPPSPSHDVVPPPVANTSPPSPSHELAPPPVANTSPPSSSHELVPPPVADTSPPSSSHELAPPPVANTSPPSPSHELVPPPVANAPHNQDPINDSPKPAPIAPVSVTTPPSSSPQKPPSVEPVIPRLNPPKSTPNVAPANKAPPFKPQAPEPVISTVSPPPPNPSTIPPPNPSTNPPPNPSTSPPPRPSKGTNGSPVASPPKRKFQPISPQNSPPLKAPPVHKSNASSPKNNVAPLSPPVIRPQAPASLPSIPSHRHGNGKENITLSPPSSLHFPPPPPVTPPPPPPIQRDAFSPKSHSHSRQKSHAAPPSLSPSTKDDHLPGSLPPQTPPPRQTPLPFPSPKASPSPSAPSPSHMKRPVLPPIHALPPPPPNKDCSPLTCKEPYTNTPPGSPCACVWPMQVGLRLGVALYTFFPLVSELAEEISIGAFMRQSQVRIMGANAANQDPEKTIVLVDLVPLGEKFDNTTAFLTADRFWNKQVAIHSSLFGNYEVLYVRYPGLPPSPPSSVNIVKGEPYFGHGDNGRSVKPLGVDVTGVHHKRNHLTGSIVAIIALSASVVLVLSIAVFWVVLSKRRRCQQGPTPPLATLPFLSKPSGLAGSIVESLPSSEMLSIPSTMAPYTGSAKTFSSTDIDKATDSFNTARVLGEGGFGRVYSGVLSDGTEVAVKVLKRDDQQGGREFLAEVEMLSRLHHRNLVTLIGICTEDRARCLVYEIVRNGSVESHLHGVGKDIAPLDWSSRLKIALGAARGLAYLHEDSSPRVIHRDFKSSNILLEDDFTPKVSDFGLARTAFEEENKHVSTRVMGTFGYVAPEYAMTGHLLVKSDVYSYGVVLLELLTGKKPVDMSQPPGRENLVSWVRPLLTNQEDLETIIDPSLGPDFPFDSIAKVSAIASMCVQPEVSHRPFMGEVVQALKLVCTECDMPNNLESRSCSHEDLLDTQSPVSNYDYGLDVESAYSGSETDIYRFKRLEKQDDGSFRRHSSSGPLRTERDKIWHKLRRFSSGTVSEHRTKPRFWSGSH